MAKGLKTAPRKAPPKASNGTNAVKVSPATAAPQAQITAPAPTPGAQPSMRILGQYLKDLSFENPNAPTSLAPQTKQPDINISVNVNARNLGTADFEVELHIDAKASADGKVIFAGEILYAGVFRMENFPENLLHPAVLIECPRMLFPFARRCCSPSTDHGTSTCTRRTAFDANSWSILERSQF